MGAVHWLQTTALRKHRDPVNDIDMQQLQTVEELLRAPEPSQEVQPEVQSLPTGDPDGSAPDTDTDNPSR